MEAMQTQGDVRTGVEMTLVCWTCGAKKTILVGKKPEFGIEFGHIVERAGWRAAEDRRVRRILAFCSDKCDEMAQTKTGLYRKYPPKKRLSSMTRRQLTENVVSWRRLLCNYMRPWYRHAGCLRLDKAEANEEIDCASMCDLTTPCSYHVLDVTKTYLTSTFAF